MGCGGFIRFSLLFLATGLPIFLSAQEPPSPAIRVEVNRVSVGVIVTTYGGKFVEGLRASDFRLFDNGVEQHITDFLSLDEPARVVLMLECGPSMFLFRNENIRTADMLIASLAPSDRVAIVCYSSGPEVRLNLTADPLAARQTLRQLNFRSGSGELNLSSSLLSVLDSLNSLSGKKTVVLISSGVDSAPAKNVEAFQNALGASDVRVLVVSTAKELRRLPSRDKHSLDEREDRARLKEVLSEGDRTLRNFAATTGGRVYFPKGLAEFEKVYLEVARLVRHEYSLAFVPQTLDGKLHTLTVRAKRPWYHLDHRQAYLAPIPAPN
jgi:VWFA-related protein